MTETRWPSSDSNPQPADTTSPAPESDLPMDNPQPVKRPKKIRKLSPSSLESNNKAVAAAAAPPAPAPVRVIPRPLSAPSEVAAALRHLSQSDPALAAVIDAHDPPSFHTFLPPFQTLTRSIINQQLAFKAAATTYSRFVALCGGDEHAVAPATVLSLSPADLRQIGISSRKANYLRDLAKKFHSGVLSDELILSMDDKSVISMLTMVEGIGAWSVHMFLIFSLHRPDVLPVGDGGVRRGVQMLYGLEEVPRPSQMVNICERWRPYRSVGSWYMWRLSEAKANGGNSGGGVGVGAGAGGEIGQHQSLLLDNIQLDGTIIATTNSKAWGSGLLQWLEFKKLGQGIRIQGGGIIEGQGSAWWPKAELNVNEETDTTGLIGKMPHTRPTALRFYGSYNVTVTGITIQNSPQCHLKFDNCEAVQVFNMSVSSPGDSPNTDGIHLQNSIDVSIQHTSMSCGDDCISIQTGSSNVHIHNVYCGPGHGISIGGLGMEKTEAYVSNVTVQDVSMNNTLTGVRIKTWQGGLGSVQDIKFSNIQVSEVKTPIVIDQFYSDGGLCKDQSSAVALSQIQYEKIKGTYTYQAVCIACSDHVPCVNISLTDIELEPQQGRLNIKKPFCWEAYGELHAPIIPPIDCLQSDKKTSQEMLFAQDSCK